MNGMLRSAFSILPFTLAYLSRHRSLLWTLVPETQQELIRAFGSRTAVAMGSVGS